MKADETIEKIRKVRHEISKECGHNPKRLVSYYKKFQKKFSHRLLSQSNTLKTTAKPVHR